MAKLTAAQRRALPDSAFAGPNRTFPVFDKDHAEAAIMDGAKGATLAKAKRKLAEPGSSYIKRPKKGH